MTAGRMIGIVGDMIETVAMTVDLSAHPTLEEIAGVEMIVEGMIIGSVVGMIIENAGDMIIENVVGMTIESVGVMVIESVGDMKIDLMVIAKADLILPTMNRTEDPIEDLTM